MALVTCICPIRWDGAYRILCDHELARTELWWDRQNEYWEGA